MIIKAPKKANNKKGTEVIGSITITTYSSGPYGPLIDHYRSFLIKMFECILDNNISVESSIHIEACTEVRVLKTGETRRVHLAENTLSKRNGSFTGKLPTQL